MDAAQEAVGRREQKKLETRQALKDSALDLALEYGIEALTVEAISATVMVAPRTFFNYFARKEDALVAEPAVPVEEIQRMLLERPSEESPLQALRVVLAQCDFFGTNHMGRRRALARKKLVQEHPPLMARQLTHYAWVERALAEALAERLGTDPGPDLRPDLLAAIAVSTLRVAMRRWSTDGEQSLERQIDKGFALLEQGDLLGAQPSPAH
ncbi:TetR/AcrR family transcriptional regulator [Brachybacterium sp. GCM10030268]|uniref:TetR/AcrR family transcriptional regulator n=1 Tax=Brachybacterium sp. GCM10030268 TaxID=3273382 RepID=UPI00362043D4